MSDYKQDYSIDEIYQIRVASARPVWMSILAVVSGAVIWALTWAMPESICAGVGAVLIVGGSIACLFFAIDHIRVSAFTRDIERRHAAKWAAIRSAVVLEDALEQFDERLADEIKAGR